jgi:hypothetical protein
MGGACDTRVVRIIVYRLLTGTHEVKFRLGRPGCRWEGNIKMDHRGIGWGTWTGLIWLRTETNNWLF